MTPPCPFCLLLDQPDHPARIAELASGIAILNVDQTYRGRSLLIHRRHVESLLALSDAEYARFNDDMRRLTAAVHATVKAERMNCAALGNVVPHLHWHVIPRFDDDPNRGGPPWPVSPAPLDGEEAYRRLAGEIARQLC
jgi:diadenosine tetraphosphate (Ap4A) HIT family hydrolase